MIRNYLSSLINISDLGSLFRVGTLTRLSLGATCLLSAKTSKEEIMVKPMKIIIRRRRSVKEGEVLKKKRNKAKRAKSPTEGPNPRIPHLALPPELGSKDRHATPRR